MQKIEYKNIPSSTSGYSFFEKNKKLKQESEKTEIFTKTHCLFLKNEKSTKDLGLSTLKEKDNFGLTIGAFSKGFNADVHILEKDPTQVVKKYHGSFLSKAITNVEVSNHILGKNEKNGGKSHPNFAVVHTLYTKFRPSYMVQNNVVKLVADRVQGTTLDSILDEISQGKRDPFSAQKINELLEQIRDACLFLCEKGIVWGSIGLSNVMITEKESRLVFLNFNTWRLGEMPKPLSLIKEIDFLVISLLLSSVVERKEDTDFIEAFIGDRKKAIEDLGESPDETSSNEDCENYIRAYFEKQKTS